MSIPETATKTLKAQQSEKTRAALLRAARKMLAERGYADTSLEEVAKRAGVTTGAVYHQYRDKSALFQAVLEQLQTEIFEDVRQGSRQRVSPAGRNSWNRLVEAAELLLDSFTDPIVCRIVMIDGPAVLGWKTWHRIRAEPILGYITKPLEHQMEQGQIEREPAAPLAYLLFGALTEAGMLIAHAADRRAARKEIGAVLLRMFNRLKLRATSPRAPELPG
ncbi:MAG: TetR/AcrR family transcriptional regulator [Candidatus Binataceae bacterium]